MSHPSLKAPDPTRATLDSKDGFMNRLFSMLGWYQYACQLVIKVFTDYLCMETEPESEDDAKCRQLFRTYRQMQDNVRTLQRQFDDIKSRGVASELMKEVHLAQLWEVLDCVNILFVTSHPAIENRVCSNVLHWRCQAHKRRYTCVHIECAAKPEFLHEMLLTTCCYLTICELFALGWVVDLCLYWCSTSCFDHVACQHSFSPPASSQTTQSLLLGLHVCHFSHWMQLFVTLIFLIIQNSPHLYILCVRCGR